MEDKIEGGVDKTLDKIDEKISGIGKKEKQSKNNENEGSGQETPIAEGTSGESGQGSSSSNAGTSDANPSTSGSSGSNNPNAGTSSSNSGSGTSSGSATGPEFKRYSKFDFVSGEKVIAYDDFSETNLGDFPLEWNTNSSAEIVTVDNTDQKWFFMSQDGFFQPEFIKEMPDNFTLEFDIFTRYRSSNIVRYGIGFVPSANPRVDLSERYLSDERVHGRCVLFCKRRR